jgi:hypothetical protein
MKQRPTTRLAIVLAAGIVLTSACGNNPDPLDLGFKRVSLDLVFKDAAKAPPPDPRKVQTVIEYFTEDYAFEEEVADEPVPRRIPRSIPRGPTVPPCLTAEPGTTPEIPPLSATKEPPEVGTYRRKNTGSIRLNVPPLPPLSLPYPFLSNWTVTDITSDVGTLATNPRDDDELPVDQVPRVNPTEGTGVVVAPVVHRFTLTRNVTADTRTIDTYQYYGDRASGDLDTTDAEGSGLYLVKREWFSSLGHRVFEPTPPVMITAIGDEHEPHQQVVTSGVDRTTNAVMTVHTQIVGREDIDVCGEVYGTYRVEFDETLVEIGPDGAPVVSGTVETGKKNVWNISFNLGLRVIREEVHRIDRATVEVAGAPVPAEVTWDYTSTLMNFAPEPLPKAKA